MHNQQPQPKPRQLIRKILQSPPGSGQARAQRLMPAKWMCLETRDSDHLHTGMELAQAGIKWMHNYHGSCREWRQLLRPPQSRMRVGSRGASPSQEPKIQFPSCPKDKTLSVNSHTEFSDPINHGPGALPRARESQASEGPAASVLGSRDRTSPQRWTPHPASAPPAPSPLPP